MRKDSKKATDTLLSDLGFESESRQTWTLWRLGPEALASPQKQVEKGQTKPASARVASPWRIESCELASRKGSLGVHNLKMRLDKEALLENLANLTKKYFGARTTGDFVLSRDGAFWCLFEFSRVTRRDPSQPAEPVQSHGPSAGIGGFKMRILADGTEGQVIISDFFGFGFVPFVFVAVPLRFLAEALGLKSWGEISRKDSAPQTIHELRFPLLAPALVHLASKNAVPAALRALESHCADAKGQFTPVVLAGDEGLRVQLTPDEIEVPVGFTECTYIPIEVLESRERVDACRPMDKLIINGKLNQAWDLAMGRCRNEPDPLYVWRRMAMLAIVGCGENSDALPVTRALELEPDHKLFLSYAVSRALANAAHMLVLENLSRIGGQLMAEVRGAESLYVFEAVLPELLGDAWATENVDKAADCYHRILEKRGEIPRVIQKLIDLARRQGRIEGEISLLHRLAKAERRRLELAKINLRLAELRRAQGIAGDDAIQLAQKALKLDRSLVQAALLTADILVERERHEEAIQALDSLLKDRHLSLPVEAKHALEAMIGGIWNHHLHRPDLAAGRYENAIKYDISDLATLGELEHIYRRSGAHVALARILEAEFTVFEKSSINERLKPIFDELVALYRGPVREPKKALDLYLRLLAASATATQDLELLFSWNDIDIDWADLSARLLSKIPVVQSGKRRGEFLCRLAEIYRDRLGDTVGAIRHLKAANQEGWIDPGGFGFLTEHLAKQRDWRALVEAYELRIQQLPPSDQQALILEMLAIPSELTDAQRDTLALRVYGFDSSADAVIKKRFMAYQQANQVDPIARLLRSVLDLRKLTTMQRLHWLREAIQSLLDLSDDRRYPVMAHIYEQMLPLVDDQTLVLTEAVAALKDGPEQKLMLFFVRELLRRGLTPELAERDIIKLLRGMDQELAVYHELMSFKATTVPVAVSHARTAAALYSKRLNQEVATEKMVARVCTLVVSTPGELAELRTLVERTGHWKLLAKALQKQAEFEDNRDEKFKLLDQLGHVFWQKIKDHARARLAFSASARFTDEPHKIHHILAKLSAEINDVEREKQHLAEYLSDTASLLDTDLLTKNAERLLRIGEEQAVVQRILQKHVDKAFSKSRWHQAAALAGVMINVGIVSSDLYKIVLKAAIIEKNSDQLVDCWWRGLACVANKSKMKVYLTETTAMIERGEMKHVLMDCYKAALDHNVGDRIGPTSKQELMLVYAGMLFDTDDNRPRALAIYSEAYADDPNDYRTWMPLYFLLLELGTPTERLSHLRAILPKLKIDQRPLKSFPLTIESLQLELKNLEKEVLLPANAVAAKGATKPVERVVEPPKVESMTPRDVASAGIDEMAEVLDIGYQGQEGVQGAVAMAPSVAAVSGDFAGSLQRGSAGGDRNGDLALKTDYADSDFDAGDALVGDVQAGSGGDNVFRIDLEPSNAMATLDEAAGMPDASSDSDLAQDDDLNLNVTAQPGVFSMGAPSMLDLQSDSIDESMDLEAGEPVDALGFVPAITGSAAIANSKPTAPPSAATGEGFANEQMGSLSFASLDAGADVDQSHVTLFDGDNNNLLKPKTDDVPLPPPPSLVSTETNPVAFDIESTIQVTGLGDLEIGGRTEFIDNAETSAIDVTAGRTSGGESFAGAVDQSDDAADWRAAVIKGDFNADLTARLLQQAFASELEKHLAIQCVALVAGNCERLSNWHWRVWRKADEYGYPLLGKERFSTRFRLPGLHSTLHKLVKGLAPIMVRKHSSLFSIEYLQKKLSVPEQVIVQTRKQIDLQKGILRDIGLRLYQEHLHFNNYSIYDLSGLGSELFFEGKNRAIYLDVAHYKQKPPSHLFHRLVSLLWSVQKAYMIPLALDPKRDAMPLLAGIHEYLNKQGFSRIKMQIAGGGGVAKYLRDFDMRPIKSLHERVGMPSEESVVQLWDAMRMHILTMQLADTLDVIGLFEALLDKDLLKPNIHKHSEIYQKSPLIRPLIEFVTKLKV